MGKEKISIGMLVRIKDLPTHDADGMNVVFIIVDGIEVQACQAHGDVWIHVRSVNGKYIEGWMYLSQHDAFEGYRALERYRTVAIKQLDLTDIFSLGI